MILLIPDPHYFSPTDFFSFVIMTTPQTTNEFLFRLTTLSVCPVALMRGGATPLKAESKRRQEVLGAVVGG
jgi:hypothetical protein